MDTSLFVACGFLLLIAWSLSWVCYARTLHPLAQVPGPYIASVTRFWMVYRMYKGDMDIVLRDLHGRYGPLLRIAPDEVTSADPAAARKIYPATKPLQKTDWYPPFAALNRFSKHDGLFTMIDEKHHSQRRRIVNNVYSLSNILTMEPDIDTCSELFLRKVSGLAAEGATIDIGEYFQWYAFDVVGELFFGQSFGYLEKATDVEGHIRSLKTLFRIMPVANIASPMVRSIMLLSAAFMGPMRRAQSAMARIPVLACACVNKRLRSGTDAGRKDLMQHLIDIMETKGEKVDFTMGDIEQEAWVALLAGSDTTAIVLTSIFYFLCRHPEAYDELELEIDTAYSTGALTDLPRYADAFRLPLLRAVVRESMRLHSPVAMSLPRYSPPQGMELSGRYVPSGFKVGMNPAIVSHDRGVHGRGRSLPSWEVDRRRCCCDGTELTDIWWRHASLHWKEYYTE